MVLKRRMGTRNLKTGILVARACLLVAAIAACAFLVGCETSPLTEVERELLPLLGKNGARGKEFAGAWERIAGLVKRLAAKEHLKPDIVNRYLNGRDEAQFLVGLLMLDELASGEAVKIGEAWLRMPQPTERKHLLFAYIATSPKPDFVPLFVEYAHDPDIHVRSAAMYGLVSVGNRTEVIPVLMESLNRGLEVYCWPIDRANPDYLRNSIVHPVGSSAAAYLLSFGDETLGMLVDALGKVRDPLTQVDILRSLHRAGKTVAMGWCRENLDAIQDSHTLFWAIRTLLAFGSQEEKKSAIDAVARLHAGAQRMIAQDLLEGQDQATLFDFCIMVAQRPPLVENLKEVFIGRALFSKLIRERFHLNENWIDGIEAFASWYRFLPIESQDIETMQAGPSPSNGR